MPKNFVTPQYLIFFFLDNLSFLSLLNSAVKIFCRLRILVTKILIKRLVDETFFFKRKKFKYNLYLRRKNLL